MGIRKRFLHGASAALVLAIPSFAQADGTVIRHKKVSEVFGVFPGGLDPDDQMGRAVTSPGDIDGDGNVDLVSGAIGDDDGGTEGATSDTGALWVHFMGANGQLLSNAKISATSGNFTPQLDTRDQLGRALESIGDFDGDGVPDIAAGACRDDDGGNNRGAFYLLFLNRDGSVKDHQKISDTEGDFDGVLEDLDEFGRSIANLGDLDGNGVIDLAIGATGDNDGGVDLKGAVWILFMNADGTVDHEQKISDTEGNFQGVLGGGDIFGFALASLGDLDGDGIAELAVGASKDDDGGPRQGAVWILFLNTNGTVRAFNKISDKADVYGLNPGDEFGSAIAGLGDLDGDGIPDMAVGAILDDGLHHDQGAVWINFMNADGTVRAKQKINDQVGNFLGNLDDGDWFGSALCTLRDLDGDGIAELAVGARFDNDGGLDTGSVWILFLHGAATVPPTAEFVADVVDGFAPLAVQFSDKSSAGADIWHWDFGDGAVSTLRNPNHVYTLPGVYTVTLDVQGPGGSAQRVHEDLVLARALASAVVRNGTGLNRVCYQSTSLPILGTSWTADVDATPHAGAGMTLVLGMSAPHAGIKSPKGEILFLPRGLGGVEYFRRMAPSGGAVAHHTLALPADVSLMGLPIYTQALILGGGIELTNAVDLVLGY